MSIWRLHILPVFRCLRGDIFISILRQDFITYDVMGLFVRRNGESDEQQSQTPDHSGSRKHTLCMYNYVCMCSDCWTNQISHKHQTLKHEHKDIYRLKYGTSRVKQRLLSGKYNVKGVQGVRRKSSILTALAW